MRAMALTERVEARATELRPAAILLSLVAFPFWLAGFIVSTLWLAVRWCVAAAQVGWSDALNRRPVKIGGADGAG